MRRQLTLMLVLGLIVVSPMLAAQEEPEPRFTTMAVCVDSGSESLAAWQIELSPVGGESEIVGIEGGVEPFEEPPYYDEAAFRSGRVVLAAFSTGENLRQGVQRVATVHAMETGKTIEYSSILKAAGNESGSRIVARVWLSRDDCKPRGMP
jgi:hypothetical protein